MHTREELGRLVHYEPATGTVTWLVDRGPVRRGAPAGSQKPGGYWEICVEYKRYYVHRVAWLFLTGEWPAVEVDHIDCNPSNNAADNLRLATPSQNKANTRRREDNTSGFKGVSWDKRKRRWVAEHHCEGRKRFLGYFGTPEDAHAAYCAEATRVFGEFARAA